MTEPEAAYLYKRKRSFSVEEVGFFEAAEKLLEVWFEIPSSWISRGGLRTIPRSPPRLFAHNCYVRIYIFFALQVKNSSSAQDCEVSHHQSM